MNPPIGINTLTLHLLLLMNSISDTRHSRHHSGVHTRYGACFIKYWFLWEVEVLKKNHNLRIISLGIYEEKREYCSSVEPCTSLCTVKRCSTAADAFLWREKTENQTRKKTIAFDCSLCFAVYFRSKQTRFSLNPCSRVKREGDL